MNAPKFCFCLAFVIGSFLYRTQAEQLCLSCAGVVKPKDCGEFTKCGSHENCFAEAFVTSIGSIRFNLGCRDVLQCNSGTPALEGKRSNLLVCSECCSGDVCNNAGCGSNGYVNRDQRGPLCASCQSQQYEDDCNMIQVCGRDQICSIRKVPTPVTHETRFKTQCEERKTCVGDVKHSREILKISTGRRDTYDAVENNGNIIRCCDGDLCNVNGSGATSHQIGTKQTVTPLLTASPSASSSLHTSTTVIKIPTHNFHTTTKVFQTISTHQSTRAKTSVKLSQMSHLTTPVTSSLTSTRRSVFTTTSTPPDVLTTQKMDLCFSNPCFGGACAMRNDTYECLCYPGFKGRNCATYMPRTSTTATPVTTATDHCKPNPCFAGNCSIYLTLNTYRCTCNYGYTGRNCSLRWIDANTDACSQQPCIHGNCYSLNQTAFQCNCEKGYIGRTCSESLQVTTPLYIDTCGSNPCGKGNCTRIDNQTFKCTCPLGYTGRTCNTKQDCPVLNIGDHVVRGPDWKWETQDVSRIGTVITIPRKGWAYVSWAEIEANYYRNGAENACDVWLYNATSASSLLMTNSNCDVHKKLCQAHCSPYGYIMDSDVCDYCLCNHGNHFV